jgi:hypothetical protein
MLADALRCSAMPRRALFVGSPTAPANDAMLISRIFVSVV